MAFNLPKYELREGRKNKGHPGILLVDEKFEFLYNKSNKDKSVFYYYCKFRKTKGVLCSAKASLAKYESEDGDVRFILKSWSDEHSHPGCMAEAIAEGMKLEMCRMVQVRKVSINLSYIYKCDECIKQIECITQLIIHTKIFHVSEPF